MPENWESPGAEEVTISYVILKSPSLSPFPDPVIYLEGGPGSSALPGLPLLQGTFADLRRYRDIIIYDQRGTAFGRRPLLRIRCRGMPASAAPAWPLSPARGT